MRDQQATNKLFCLARNMLFIYRKICNYQQQNSNLYVRVNNYYFIYYKKQKQMNKRKNDDIFVKIHKKVKRETEIPQLLDH